MGGLLAIITSPDQDAHVALVEVQLPRAPRQARALVGQTEGEEVACRVDVKEHETAMPNLLGCALAAITQGASRVAGTRRSAALLAAAVRRLLQFGDRCAKAQPATRNGNGSVRQHGERRPCEPNLSLTMCSVCVRRCNVYMCRQRRTHTGAMSN